MMSIEERLLILSSDLELFRDLFELVELTEH